MDYVESARANLPGPSLDFPGRPDHRVRGRGYGADQLGTSWFQKQGQLTPQLVTGGTFGRVLTGKVSTKGYPSR